MNFLRRNESTRPRNPTSMRRRLQLLRSYLPDWIITIVLAAGFFALNDVPGFKREFSITDTSLRHPFATKERVPSSALYLIAFVAPFVLQPIINLLTVRSWWDFHNGSLGLILSLALAGSITQFTKITVGRPRPDIISRCNPVSGIQNPEYGLVSVDICRQTNLSMLRDGFRSFPSGHSSLSFAGLGFLTWYLAGKLHLFDERGHAGKAWLAVTPLAGAALVAISRTMDYRHHWQDVLVGSALGLFTSYFAYRQYYPSLSSPISHRPFSPRVPREEVDQVLPLTNAQSNHASDRHYRNSSHAPLREGAVPPAGYRDSLSDEDVRANMENVELVDGAVRPQNPTLTEIYQSEARN